MKHEFLYLKSFFFFSFFIENDQIQYFIPVSHSNVEFCRVQKQKGKLVFSKSGFFHI